ncbi:MAG: DNA polymerase III subunit gamma/tau [Bacilli bacterium]
MSYKALYRTYRPKTFSEVVGQRAIIKTLKNSIEQDKIAHAYLFCGPRGTGKTTMARLFAKALNCSTGRGNQCNHCENCQAIMKGNHPDVFEIDAASNSGVENVRNLIEQVGFAPIMGRYKVYIIDEVHSMTPSAFNALLKTLEEPPANVVFILATTEPNKVLPTILSRVQRYDFTKVSSKDIVYRMKQILDSEGIAYEESALNLIARMADGGVRDALSLLDQAISYCADTIKESEIYHLFGLLQIEDKINIIRYCHLNDVKSSLELVRKKAAEGADIVRLHDDLINIYKDLLIFGTTKDSSLLSFLKPNEALTITLSAQEIRNDLDILIKARRNYKNVTNIFDEFELTIIKIAMKPETIRTTAAVTTTNMVTDNEKSSDKKVESANMKKTTETDATPLENKKKDKSQVLKASSISSDDMKEEDGDSLILDEETIINIMVQGNKKLKKDLIEEWDKQLDTILPSDKFYYLAQSLIKCKPVIACNDVVVVKTFFKGIASNLNLLSNQVYLTMLMKDIFGFDNIKVVALQNSKYIDFVNAFKNYQQAKSLPKPKKIVFKDTRESKKTEKGEKTNAQSFVESLGI